MEFSFIERLAKNLHKIRNNLNYKEHQKWQDKM